MISAGFDIKTNVVELLQEIVKIKGDFKVRLGMANPNHVLTILDDLIEIFQNEKMFKFLHIPIQSGNDEVLSAMNRKYKVADFEKIVKKFRAKIPDISIATDVICGFPTETDSQFDDTLKLIKNVKPDVLNASKFWSLPGTRGSSVPPASAGSAWPTTRR